jgi:hypothetical protein
LHASAQAPQFCGSLGSATQAPLQAVSPPPQVAPSSALSLGASTAASLAPEPPEPAAPPLAASGAPPLPPKESAGSSFELPHAAGAKQEATPSATA